MTGKKSSFLSPFNIYHLVITLLTALVFSFTWPFFKYGEPSPQHYFKNDFMFLYVLARIVTSPQYKQIYDADLQLAISNEILAPLHEDTPFCFPYPPYAFMFCAPLGFMPFHLAYRVHQIVTLLFGAGIFVWLYKKVTEWSAGQLLVLLQSALIAFPVFLGVTGGQYHLFFFALFALFFYGLASKKELPAGVGLALSSMKLQYAPMFGLILLMNRKWKAIGACFATLALLLVASGLWFGFDNIVNYPKILLFTETSKTLTGIYPENHICIRGLFLRIMPEKLAHTSTTLMYIGALAGCAWMWLKGRGKGDLVFGWGLAIATLANLVFALHVQFQDCLYLALAIPFTINGAQREMMRMNVLQHGAFWYRAWCVMLAAFPFTSWLQPMFDISKYGRTLILALNMILLFIAIWCWKIAMKTANARIAAVSNASK